MHFAFGPSFLMFPELPADFGGELSKYIDEAVNPCLGDGALISLDQIVWIAWPPHRRDHSNAE
jgi:hypothetical protein